MGQQEILEFLYRRRASGDDGFFTAEEIIKGTGGNGKVRKQLMKLEVFGYVQMKAYKQVGGWGKETSWKQRYRLRAGRIPEVRRMMRE